MWALALAGLLAFAGHRVVAQNRSQTGTPQPTTPQQLPNGQGGRSGRFGGGGPQGSTLNVGWEWWKDEAVKKEIGLRPDQAKNIDGFYSHRVKDIDPVVQEYLKEESALDKMAADRAVDDSTFSIEVTKYYALRTLIGQSHTMMCYRIAKVLDVDQYAKLKAIADRRLKEAEARRGRGGGLAPAPGGLLR